LILTHLTIPRSYGFFHEKEVSFKNGILEVRSLKTEEAKAKEVKVKIDLS